jgi:glycosyltransferase involved in cell wall biosynthesis
MPAVDVLMPVLNGVRFLGESVDSIRSQTFSDWRLLVLDHGSCDGSAELARRYADADKRINVFSFPEADGIAELRNFGLEKCDCRYVLVQDADDISFPNRMSIISDFLRDYPDVLAVGGDVLVIDEAGRQTGYTPMPTDPKTITAAGFFYNPMHHAAVAANFGSFKRFGAKYGRDILNLVPAADSITINRLAEDYILFGQLALLGPCANVGIPLIKYRRHSGGVGMSNPIEQIELALRVSRFLAQSFCLMKGVQEFDPRPFCNHGENVLDFGLRDYTDEFGRMAGALHGGLGQSAELKRELAFRWILATRYSGVMAARFLQFHSKYIATQSERRTVRNWLLRGLRRHKTARGG